MKTYSPAAEAACRTISVYPTLRIIWARYDSPENFTLWAEKVDDLAAGLIEPNPTLAQRAFLDLYNSGEIQRTDHSDDETDKALARKESQDKLVREVNAVPLDERLFDRFARMAPAEVSQQYYSDKRFRLLYDRAVAAWHFQKPQQPATPITSADLGEWTGLNAERYRRMPTSQTVNLYNRDKKFRFAVDRLIAQGAI